MQGKRPIVLGSASPRRREILMNLGVAFVVHPANADERVLAGERPAQYLERVTLAKLDAVRASAPASIDADVALVADTSVVEGGAILGKPESDDEGRAMLERLSGRTHEVMTRFAIGRLRDPAGAPLHAETVTTRVTFRALGRDEIDAYVATGEGRDKAGGYAVQGRATGFVSRIDGSYSCVVDLPACEVIVALRALRLV